MDDLFGSDDEDEQHSPPKHVESSSSAKDKTDSPKADMDVDDDMDGTPRTRDKFDEDSYSPAPDTDKEKTLDSILGESNYNETASVSKLPVRSKLVLPERVFLPEDAAVRAFVKLPKLVKVQTNCANEDDKDTDESGSTLIKWRHKRDASGNILKGSDGKPIRESNAKLVRLSNGEHKLVLGDLLFNVTLHQAENSFAYVVQKSVIASTENGNAEEEDPHGGLDGEDTQKTVSVLECAGSLSHRMVIHPESIRSETHSKLSEVIREKHTDKKKVVKMEAEVYENPEISSENKVKEIAMEQRKARKRATQDGGYDMSKYAGGSRRPSMSAAYLDEGDNYDDINLSQIKNKKNKKYDRYGDGDDGEGGGKKRTRKADADEMDDFIEDDDDDDDYGYGGGGSDDDDDDDEGGDGSEDDENFEKKLQAKEAKTLRRDKDYVPDEDDEGSIDFGSEDSEEEEEEDFGSEDSDDDEDDIDLGDDDDEEEEGDDGKKKQKKQKEKKNKKDKEKGDKKKKGDKEGKKKAKPSSASEGGQKGAATSAAAKETAEAAAESTAARAPAPSRSKVVIDDDDDDDAPAAKPAAASAAEVGGAEEEPAGSSSAPVAKRPRKTVVIDSDDEV